MELVADPDDAGRLVAAARDFPSNRGGMCRKGWTSAEPLQSTQRLTSPLVRDGKGEALRPASWPEALGRIADGIEAAQAKGGADGVGVFGGGGLTNEKAYMLGKFARVGLGTRYIDYNGRFCMASAAAAGNRAFGMDRGLPFPLADIPEVDTILIVGSNPAETMPPIMQYFDAQRARGGTLIVADARRTATAGAATLFLQPAPGTDAALALGLLHIVIRDRLIDEAYIAERTEGFDAVRRVAAAWWPDRTERTTGVPAEQLREVAHLLGRSRRSLILTGRGPEQQSHGVDNVLSFINLALALGLPGRPFAGWGTLTGQGNGQGGREHGQKSDQLPGYRSLANETHRAEIAAIWGVPAESLPPPGPPAGKLLDRCGGEISALLVFGSNLLLSAPDSTKVQRRLEALDLLVVSDPFLSETAAIADVVLPVAQWAEEEGTMTNLEGRIILRRRMADPAPGVWTDLQVISGIADRLGKGAYFTPEPQEAFAELRRASAGGVADYAGVTWERIVAEEGVFWPCPSEDHPGTPRPFGERFATANGLAKFHRIEHRATSESPDRHYPMILTTGRVMAHYNTGVQTRRVGSLNEADPEAFCELHADMARTIGVKAGDRIRLSSRRGSAIFVARLSRTIRLDTVFVPFHWAGDAVANLLTSTYTDPVSGIPEFKVCAVHIARAGPGRSVATAEAAGRLPA